MKTFFSINGNTVNVIKMNPDMVKDKLNPGVYQVLQDPSTGKYFLEINNSFFRNETVIGDEINKKINKVIYAYDNYEHALGILLTGYKGSGKTLMIRQVAKQMFDKGLPIILVNSKYHDAEFVTFMDNLGEVMIIFDEFAKHFDIDEQHLLLGFLDGLSNKKRLVAFTENEESDIAVLFKDRPSRIWYHFKFNGLRTDAVEEYCKMNDVEEIITDILNMMGGETPISFDILQSIIKEYKLHDRKNTIHNIVQDMNINYGNVVMLSIKGLYDLKNKVKYVNCFNPEIAKTKTYDKTVKIQFDHTQKIKFNKKDEDIFANLGIYLENMIINEENIEKNKNINLSTLIFNDYLSFYEDDEYVFYSKGSLLLMTQKVNNVNGTSMSNIKKLIELIEE